MIFSNDYVGYMARKTVSGLLNAKVIKTTKPQLLSERVAAGLLDELKLEDLFIDAVFELQLIQ